MARLEAGHTSSIGARFPGAIFFPRLPGGKIIRDTEGLPETLGRIGSLEVKLAVRKKEIRKAQKLRFKVFFNDGGARANPHSAITRRDICPFDRVCDHILVVDHAALSRFGRPKPRIVGVYRLLRQEKATSAGGFYSAGEFDIAPLLARHPDKRFCELGRSCVHPDWRSRRVLELLWRGVWTYARHHRVDVLIGCASLPGVNPADHAAAFSFLAREARVSGEWRASPRSDRLSFPIRALGVGAPHISRANLPTLIKGYLRLGARFGDGAVVDRQFGVTDVLVIMPVADIDPRYRAYFTPDSAPDSIAA